MITNERQYKITRSHAEKFRRALDEMAAPSFAREGVHPRLIQAEREALESQLQDLTTELQEYENLKKASPAVISLDSFDQLPDGLIKARIASGLSQKALAERLGIKEQQIQRYESERYASASYQRLREIALALDIRIRNDILLPIAPGNFQNVVDKLQQAGLEKDFLVGRLLSSADASRANGEVAIEDDSALTTRTSQTLERIFGWTRENLLGRHPLTAPRFAAAEGRFKMPGGRNQAASTLYAAYANHLAIVALLGARDIPTQNIPTDAQTMRRAILSRYKSLNLSAVLNYAWDLGVPVLPLKDRGAFHGACWRYERRNTIVLKQNSRHEARWQFDLLHELFHAGQQPESDTLEVIEADETSPERRNSDEEIAASQFAGDVSLDGKAEEIAEACVKAARNSVERLKSVVPRVAAEYRVSTGALANYMAFRLSWQDINWWGAAANLQAQDGDPWAISRDVFFERFPNKFVSDIDRQLLERALH